MSNEASHLTITVDKSHILSLGERLYEQSIELIRKLVNNAYDADATRVDVTVSGKEIVVADNGEGQWNYRAAGGSERTKNPKMERINPCNILMRMYSYGVR